MKNLLILLVVFLPLSAEASKTAKELYEHCTSFETLEKVKREGDEKKVMGILLKTSLCTAYIQGVADGFRLLSDAMDYLKTPVPSQSKFCLPQDGLKTEKALFIFLKYYEKTKEVRDSTARLAVVESLRATYPCSVKSFKGIEKQKEKE